MNIAAKVTVAAASGLFGVVIAAGGAFAATGSSLVANVPGQSVHVSGVGPAQPSASIDRLKALAVTTAFSVKKVLPAEAAVVDDPATSLDESTAALASEAGHLPGTGNSGEAGNGNTDNGIGNAGEAGNGNIDNGVGNAGQAGNGNIDNGVGNAKEDKPAKPGKDDEVTPAPPAPPVKDHPVKPPKPEPTNNGHDNGNSGNNGQGNGKGHDK